MSAHRDDQRDRHECLPGHDAAVDADGAGDERDRADRRSTLSWTASTDNVGVTGYRLAAMGDRSVRRPRRAMLFSGLACGTSYSLGVVALDAAGNVSGTGDPELRTTAACSSAPPRSATCMSPRRAMTRLASAATRRTRVSRSRVRVGRRMPAMSLASRRAPTPRRRWPIPRLPRERLRRNRFQAGIRLHRARRRRRFGCAVYRRHAVTTIATGLTLGSPGRGERTNGPSYVTFQNLHDPRQRGDHRQRQGRYRAQPHVLIMSPPERSRRRIDELRAYELKLGDCYNPADFSGPLCEASPTATSSRSAAQAARTGGDERDIHERHLPRLHREFGGLSLRVLFRARLARIDDPEFLVLQLRRSPADQDRVHILVQAITYDPEQLVRPGCDPTLIAAASDARFRGARTAARSRTR